MARVVKFCYDIVCPYAYMASTQIEEAARACGGATVEWTPVLLGGLYRMSGEPQGKDNSATDAMPRAKAVNIGVDMRRQASRRGVPLSFHPRHPLRTLKAQRLLVAADSTVRPALTRDLYRAYWVDNADIDDEGVLEVHARRHGLDISVINSEAVKTGLLDNTTQASDRGAWGVPTMFVGDEMFWGTDRLHFVQRALGHPNPVPFRRIQSAGSAPAAGTGRLVRFYFDFASPWTFLGYTQVDRMAAACGATVEYVPMVLGAVFKAVGQHNTPMATMTERKRTYAAKDMNDWAAYLGETVVWPDHFPIRTILPLRVYLADPRTIDCIFRAAWQRNVNIGEADQLLAVLNGAGFDGPALIQAAGAEHVKGALKRHTDDAIAQGVYGAPTFQPDGSGGSLVFGQDRLDTVRDMLLGWDENAPGSRL